jgi:lipoate---protein ligase
LSVILVDNKSSANPYINLAIEEFLVRNDNCDGHDYVLLYINDPCIVVGKNQSIWKEVNIEYLRNGKLKLCRRISGGGTVYHDDGNLSFAFISKFSDEKVNNYKLFNQPIVNALLSLGIEAEMDTRNNILSKGKKISGSAQFTDRKNIISHGTLLWNADLYTLRAALKENEFEIETRAVSSVRSPVMNISKETEQLSSTEDLKHFLIKQLQVNETLHFNEADWSTILKLADEKFQSLEWIYGRSPHTQIKKDGLEIEIEAGKITRINTSASLYLEGCHYQYDEIKKALCNMPNASDILRKVF